ncbi:hypothetical protein FN846DRAFT_928307, partial [Sphaerosporella brunnea]
EKSSVRVGFDWLLPVCMQSITQKKSGFVFLLVPTDYLAVVLRWLRFNRRNSEGVEARDTTNTNQTPAPYEYLDGGTYTSTGDKTVWAKVEKSGWDKRKATIKLTVRRDAWQHPPRNTETIRQ